MVTPARVLPAATIIATRGSQAAGSAYRVTHGPMDTPTAPRTGLGALPPDSGMKQAFATRRASPHRFSDNLALAFPLAALPADSWLTPTFGFAVVFGMSTGAALLLGAIMMRRLARSPHMGTPLSRGAAAVLSQVQAARAAPSSTLVQAPLPDVVVGGVSYPARFIQFVRAFGPQVFVERNGPFVDEYKAPKAIAKMNPAHLKTVYALWLNRVIRVERQEDPAAQTGLFTVVMTYHSAPHGIGVMTTAGNMTSGHLVDLSGGRLMKVVLADHGERPDNHVSGRVKVEQQDLSGSIYAHVSEYNRLLPVLKGQTHPDDFYNGTPLWYFSARELSPVEAQGVRTEVKRLGASFNTPGLEVFLRGLFAQDLRELGGLAIPEHASFSGLIL